MRLAHLLGRVFNLDIMTISKPVFLGPVAAVALAVASGLLAGCATQSTAAGGTAGRYSVALWGDMPYAKAGDGPKMPALLKSINDSDVAFSVYDGDLKDGSSVCSDKVYTESLAMFNTLKKPAVYVVGDNEWTDCHRLNNGGMNALERLGHIRNVMFPTLDSLGQTPMPLEHQGKLGGKFVENLRWSYGGVVYMGLNMPGSNNNLVMNARDCTKKSARHQSDCDADNAEYLERDDANVKWMTESFAKAKAEGARGVVVVVQADPGFDLLETADVDESTFPEFAGYRNFMDQLARQTQQFDGQVLFVHGDAHYFKVDKPLFSQANQLPNFTRLQTFGSPNIHWVKLTVDVNTPQVFHFDPVMVKQ
jgi:hypothetical protein